MNDIQTVIAPVLHKGVRLWVHHNNLYFCDPAGLLTAEERGALVTEAHAVILSLFESRATVRQDKGLGLLEEAPCEIVPLTFQQEAALTYPEVYFIIPGAILLKGNVNVEALSESLKILVDRHSALRVRIELSQGTLKQHIGARGAFRLLIEPERCPTDAELESRLRILLNEWLQAGEPAFQAKLISRSSTEHVLVVLWDHLVEDNHSAQIFFRELWSVYLDLVSGRPPSLPAPLIQYADYARWQRTTYSNWAARHSSYWQKKVAGVAPLRPPENLLVKRGEYGLQLCPVSFGRELSGEIERFTRSQASLVAFAVLALFIASLSCAWKMAEFLIPYMVSGRHNSRQFGLVGLLAHPIVMRFRIDTTDTFVSILKAVGKEFLEASSRIDNGITPTGCPSPYHEVSLQWFDFSPSFLSAVTSTPAGWGAAHCPEIDLFPFDWLENAHLGEWPILLHTMLWKSDGAVQGCLVYRKDMQLAEPLFRTLTSFAQLAVANPERPIIQLFHSLIQTA